MGIKVKISLSVSMTGHDWTSPGKVQKSEYIEIPIELVNSEEITNFISKMIDEIRKEIEK